MRRLMFSLFFAVLPTVVFAGNFTVKGLGRVTLTLPSDNQRPSTQSWQQTCQKMPDIGSESKARENMAILGSSYCASQGLVFVLDQNVSCVTASKVVSTAVSPSAMSNGVPVLPLPQSCEKTTTCTATGECAPNPMPQPLMNPMPGSMM